MDTPGPSLQVRSRRMIFAILLGVVVFGGILVILDWDRIRNVLEQANWRPIPLAILLTFISYFCVSYSFARVARMLGIQMSLRDLSEVAFVSTSLNHVLTGGGIAGYSLRYFLMQRYGIELQDVLTASILHFYFTSLAMLAMLPAGFVYLILNSPLSQTAIIILGLVTLLMVLVFLIASGLVFMQSIRGPFLHRLARFFRSVIHRDLETTLHQFDAALTQGVAVIREQPSELLPVMILIVVDWITSAITLGFCFTALGPPVRPGVLMAGYVIGIMAGVLSLVPGGLVVQEGSMAGVFALLGVSFEQAVLAAILFRAIYFLLPYFISLAFYWRLLRGTPEKITLKKEG